MTVRWSLFRALLAAAVSAAGAQQAVRAPALPSGRAPLGLPEREAGTSADDAVASLGASLFFDPILSSDRTVSCSSCHDPARAFADSIPYSSGVQGRRTTRNTPTLFNRVYGQRFMWDGRAATLEEQALFPIENP